MTGTAGGRASARGQLLLLSCPTPAGDAQSNDRKKGSGKPATATTDENLAEVKQLRQSQEDKPRTHNGQPQAYSIPSILFYGPFRLFSQNGT